MLAMQDADFAKFFNAIKGRIDFHNPQAVKSVFVLVRDPLDSG